MKYFKVVFSLIISLSYASFLEESTVIKSGDSLNKIMKTMKVSQNSINQLNASHRNVLKPFERIKPGDSMKCTLSPKTRTALSCQLITTQGKLYLLNKHSHQYHLHHKTDSDGLHIIQVATNRVEDLSPHETHAIRATKMLFPNQQGEIYAAFNQKNSLLTVKLITFEQTFYAFLKQSEHGIAAYYNTNGELIAPEFSRTPTNYTRISSPFNPQRLHPITKKITPHKGVDLAAPINTPVWAAANGVISHISTDTGYGNLLVIRHPTGVETYYAHLNKFHKNIKVGQRVSAFETIGYVGSTGRSTGPHLHFEYRQKSTPIDPLKAILPSFPKKYGKSIENNFYF